MEAIERSLKQSWHNNTISYFHFTSRLNHSISNWDFTYTLLDKGMEENIQKHLWVIKLYVAFFFPIV